MPGKTSKDYIICRLLLLAVTTLFLCALPACKGAKEATHTYRPEKIPAGKLLARVEQQFINPEWFSGRAKMQYKDPEQQLSFTANIRYYRDSIIWASLTGTLGVEAARVLITPDSVKIIDRLNKKYLNEPRDYLKNYVPLDVTPSFLQKLILGQPEIDRNAKMHLKTEDGIYHLELINRQSEHHLWINPADYTIQRIHSVDMQNGYEAIVDLDAYAQVEGKPFAFKRNIHVNAMQPVELAIEFSRVKTGEPVDFPFTVSDKYERTN